MSTLHPIEVKSSKKDTIFRNESNDEFVLGSKPKLFNLFSFYKTILEIPEAKSESLLSMPLSNSQPPLPVRNIVFRIFQNLLASL